MSQAIDKIINAAIATLGVGESNGNNTNYITQWYGMNDAWCDMSVSYWAAHSGNAAVVGHFAYTVYHAQWFKDKGQWHAMTNGVVNSGIRRGDIIFFDWAGGSSISGIDHVGIVESVSGSVVHTIEGNIDNKCGRHTRTVETIAGFGRPSYAVDTTPPVKPTPPPVHPALPWVSYKQIHAAAVSSTGKVGADGSANSSKDDVLTYQKGLSRLVGLDYSSGPGVFGLKTKAATKKFQTQQNWTGADADGIPGPETVRRVASKSGLFQARDFDSTPDPTPTGGGSGGPVVPPTPVGSTPGRIVTSQVEFKLKGKQSSGYAACLAYTKHACQILGIPETYWVPGLMTIMSRESAYNSPDWQINTTDSNAKNVSDLFGGGNAPDGYKGMCSRGCVQCIPQTFARCHVAGTSLDIYDAVASIAAGANYIMLDYGVAHDGHDLAAKVHQADPTHTSEGY